MNRRKKSEVGAAAFAYTPKSLSSAYATLNDLFRHFKQRVLQFKISEIYVCSIFVCGKC